MTKQEKVTWLNKQCGPDYFSIEDDYVDFYYETMHGFGVSIGDADRYAWLGTLLGYDIGYIKAAQIDSWYYENGLEVMEIGLNDLETLRNVCESELGFYISLENKPDEEPKYITYDWYKKYEYK